MSTVLVPEGHRIDTISSRCLSERPGELFHWARRSTDSARNKSKAMYNVIASLGSDVLVFKEHRNLYWKDPDSCTERGLHHRSPMDVHLLPRNSNRDLVAVVFDSFLYHWVIDSAMEVGPKV